jgi:hypothetical protein
MRKTRGSLRQACAAIFDKSAMFPGDPVSGTGTREINEDET